LHHRHQGGRGLSKFWTTAAMRVYTGESAIARLVKKCGGAGRRTQAAVRSDILHTEPVLGSLRQDAKVNPDFKLRS
jgi:hypothetical protein